VRGIVGDDVERLRDVAQTVVDGEFEPAPVIGLDRKRDLPPARLSIGQVNGCAGNRCAVGLHHDAGKLPTLACGWQDHRFELDPIALTDSDHTSAAGL
jgi:hypothetical protein